MRVMMRTLHAMMAMHRMMGRKIRPWRNAGRGCMNSSKQSAKKRMRRARNDSSTYRVMENGACRCKSAINTGMMKVWNIRTH